MGPGQLFDRFARPQVHLDENRPMSTRDLLRNGLLCLDTSTRVVVSDVLNSHTSPSAK